MDVVIAGLSSASKVALPPRRLKAGGNADAGKLAFGTQPIAFFLELGVVGVGEHLVDDGVIVAAVVGGAARNHVGEFFVADQVAPAHLQRIEVQNVGDLIHDAFKREIGWPLAEAADRILRGLVGDNRDGAVLHASDLVGTDDGADRLAELERRTPGVGANIFQRAHLH